MHVSSSRLLVSLLSAATALAQSNPVAYPQHGVDGNSGHTAPIGVQYFTTNSDENRWQQLIPERFLPNTACLFSGLQLVVMTSFANRTILYVSMQVTMSVAPANGTLSMTFANNLTSPQVVLSLANQSLTWNPNQWNTVTFQQPFVYPGSGDLVIDLRKVVNPMTISYPSRPDLPQAISSWGAPNSGAASNRSTLVSTTADSLGFARTSWSIPTNAVLLHSDIDLQVVVSISTPLLSNALHITIGGGL